jgi:hypothetical protein
VEAGSSQPPSVRLPWRVMLHLGFMMIKISKVSEGQIYYVCRKTNKDTPTNPNDKFHEQLRWAIFIVSANLIAKSSSPQ